MFRHPVSLHTAQAICKLGIFFTGKDKGSKNLKTQNHVACDLQTSTANLERVRKMKTRHQRLQTRVTTVREELQSFLEDDDDMMKMCLTYKMEQGHNLDLVRAQG